MNTAQAYDEWVHQYDSNVNKTRDLEAVALRDMLAPLPFENCLEMGCGTGKNTAWLATRAKQLLAVDFSEGMLRKAADKITAGHVRFQQADMNAGWHFVTEEYDVVTFSLVLEHIEHLQPVFEKAAAALRPGGCMYVGELHPFKQYIGSKARFDTAAGEISPDCYTHHFSHYTQAAFAAGLSMVRLKEFFDDDVAAPPRILTLLFQKPIIG
jgi:ubiquinone/menaquinone biosynthesis C-methylase UbiE